MPAVKPGHGRSTAGHRQPDDERTGRTSRRSSACSAGAQVSSILPGCRIEWYDHRDERARHPSATAGSPPRRAAYHSTTVTAGHLVRNAVPSRGLSASPAAEQIAARLEEVHGARHDSRTGSAGTTAPAATHRPMAPPQPAPEVEPRPQRHEQRPGSSSGGAGVGERTPASRRYAPSTPAPRTVVQVPSRVASTRRRHLWSHGGTWNRRSSRKRSRSARKPSRPAAEDDVPVPMHAKMYEGRCDPHHTRSYGRAAEGCEYDAPRWTRASRTSRAVWRTPG